MQDVASAINRALLLSPSEKLHRHTKLYKVVTTHTSHTWALMLMKMLLRSGGGSGDMKARATPYLPKDMMEELYGKAKKRLFFFDYDVSWGFHSAFRYFS